MFWFGLEFRYHKIQKMVYLTKEFVAFFEDLARNNNRDWFHANKKRYENTVKKPFQNFVGALIEAFKAVEPDTSITNKEAIFRIHRDIRFSKDKTPYKLHASATISTTHKKDFTNPNGIYVEITPEHIRQYSGVYGPDKEMLLKIRRAIAAQPDKFARLIENKYFKKTFSTIQGEQHKRIPKEFKAAHAQQPLIANKQFYYYSTLDINMIDSDDLIDQLIAHYKVARPVNEFFAEALKG